MLKIKEKNRGNKRRKEGREERREEGKKKLGGWKELEISVLGVGNR